MAYSDDARPADDRLRVEVRLAKQPIHPMLVPFPIVSFVGALATDIAYASTTEMMWADFSAWLLVVGMITGILTSIAGLIDLLRNRLMRATGRHRNFASGLRNPNGLTFEPQTGALWAVVNERDELGSDLVPDYMTSVKGEAFYSWPYSYYGQHVETATP